MTLTRNKLRWLSITSPRASIHNLYPLVPPYPVAAIADELSRIEREALEMAGKQKSANPLWNKTEFVNITLDVEQGKAFKVWNDTQGEKIADLLGEVIVDDYKVSVSWDDNNQCFIATFTGKEDQRFNSFKSMSSRSDEWYEALAITLYKHLVISKGGNWSGESQKNNWG